MRIDNNPADDTGAGRHMTAAKITPFLCKFHFISFEKNNVLAKECGNTQPKIGSLLSSVDR